MAAFPLAPQERRQILRLIERRAMGKSATRRAQAILSLADGKSVEEVAEQLGVTCRTVYNWMRRLKQESPSTVTKRLSDKPRSGRPSIRKELDNIIESLLDYHPYLCGYRTQTWTPKLLQQCLRNPRLRYMLDTSTWSYEFSEQYFGNGNILNVSQGTIYLSLSRLRRKRKISLRYGLFDPFKHYGPPGHGFISSWIHDSPTLVMSGQEKRIELLFNLRQAMLSEKPPESWVEFSHWLFVHKSFRRLVAYLNKHRAHLINCLKNIRENTKDEDLIVENPWYGQWLGSWFPQKNQAGMMSAIEAEIIDIDRYMRKFTVGENRPIN